VQTSDAKSFPSSFLIYDCDYDRDLGHAYRLQHRRVSKEKHWSICPTIWQFSLADRWGKAFDLLPSVQTRTKRRLATLSFLARVDHYFTGFAVGRLATKSISTRAPRARILVLIQNLNKRSNLKLGENHGRFFRHWTAPPHFRIHLNFGTADWH
jgi:hypothetical protein